MWCPTAKRSRCAGRRAAPLREHGRGGRRVRHQNKDATSVTELQRPGACGAEQPGHGVGSRSDDVRHPVDAFPHGDL